jgi:phosphotransferase system enzyme I (PtsI)
VTELHGRGVSPGVGAGPVRQMADPVPEPPADTSPADPADELAAAEAALEAVAADLESRGERSGGAAEEVLLAQAMMARDPGLAEAVADSVHSGQSAARAVFEAFGGYRELIAGARSYVAGRVADLDDVRDRVVARLLGVAVPGVPQSAEPFVLVGRDIAPADTALLDPDQVLAFVTEEGGPTSHSAILARSLGVPAVVACPGARDVRDGSVVLVDGTSGVVRLAPSPAELARASAARATARSRAGVTGPGRTADGRAVPLLANIGRPGDLRAALAAGAEGIGLFRTEFLFLDRDRPPDQAEQEAAYRTVLAAFPQGKVVVRVLDAGADKPLAFVPAGSPEPNPALGARGIRLLRRHPDLLDRQLAALARAVGAADSAASAELEVMAPMVGDAEEARWFAGQCRAAGIDRGIGVMVEVPAAALRAADIMAEVDFVSIGTNDLTQYAYAADRMLGSLAELQDPWQPALLDLVAMVAGAAAGTDRRTGVCGEAAADPALACVLVGLGVDTLSMGPGSLEQVRAALARHTVDQCVAAASAARAAPSGAEARAAGLRELPGLDPRRVDGAPAGR